MSVLPSLHEAGLAFAVFSRSNSPIVALVREIGAKDLKIEVCCTGLKVSVLLRPPVAWDNCIGHWSSRSWCSTRVSKNQRDGSLKVRSI